MKAGRKVIFIVEGHFKEGFVVKDEQEKITIKAPRRIYTRTKGQVVVKKEEK